MAALESTLEPGAAPYIPDMNALSIDPSPSQSQSQSSSSKKATKPPKEIKKKYPKIRNDLFEHYGLSIRDHFIRDCIAKLKMDENSIKYDLLFAEAINQTLTSIAEPFIDKLMKNQNKLTQKSLLQVFSVRDVSIPLSKWDQLNVGSSRSRMLYFVLTDGKSKVGAVEYQHIELFELLFINYPCTKMYILCLFYSNLGIFPGTKVQIESASIMDGMIVLRPSNVLWIGGDVESFSSKVLKTAKSRDKDTRVFIKNLAKNETPPPQFEDIDLTAKKKKKKLDKYEKNYNDDRIYNDSYQKAKGGGYNESNYYDDGGGNEEDNGQYYEDQKKDAYKAVNYEEAKEQQPQQQNRQRYKRKREQNDANNNYQKQQQQPQRQDHRYRHQNEQYSSYQDQRYQPRQDQRYANNQNHRYEAPKQQYQPKSYQSPRRQNQHNPYSQNLHYGNAQHQQQQPQSLQELYAVNNLPFVATFSAQIIAAKLNFTPQAHEPYIEFDLSDKTGKCKAMTSTYLMQWVCSKYGTQINQEMVDAFFNQWGNRFIIIKMELKDKARMIIVHEIKWQ